jgi:hypothetical protein
MRRAVPLRRSMAELFEHLADPFLAAMRIADLDIHDPFALPVLDDLDLRQAAGDAKAYLRQSSLSPGATGAIGLTKEFRKQGVIAGITIGQQHQVVSMMQTTGTLQEQASNQGFMASALHRRAHELAGWIDQFCFPSGCLFVGGVAVALVCLQCCHRNGWHSLLVEGLSVFAQA